MHWNEGYAVDVEYTTEFFGELSPSHLNVVCILNGIEPVALDKPFTYCELGCGQGFSANILAASHPQGQFYAVDFMAEHIARAQALADSAQLRNLTLLEASFGDLADGRISDIPQFDFITLHGVYTWVNQECRDQVVRFIAKHLKPGGVVYVSFNTLPGWAATLPLQRLLMLYADRHPDRSDRQLQQARGLIGALREQGARYFSGNAGNAAFSKHLDVLSTATENYVVHEFMHQNWQPMYFADVASHLAEAGLSHAGASSLLKAFPERYFSQKEHAFLDGFADDIPMRETMKDYLRNTSFRKDVFVRDAQRMTPQRQADWLARMGLALSVADGAAKLDAVSWAPDWIGEHEAIYLAVLEALRDGPKTLPQLLSLCHVTDGQARGDMSLLIEIGVFLVESGQGAFIFPAVKNEAAPARAMNAAIARESRRGDHYQALASPVLGNGLVSGLWQRLVYDALLRQEGGTDDDNVIREVREALQRQGPQDATFDEESLSATVRAILARRLPVWKQLGMI
jgi:SAM-dependent methyltransferase